MRGRRKGEEGRKVERGGGGGRRKEGNATY